MWLFFTSTLVISIAGLVSLMALKRWEMATGKILGGSLRPKVGARAHRGLSWLEHALPGLVRQWIAEGGRYARVMFHRFAALAVLLVERGLEKFLQLIRVKTSVKHSDAQASAFLREVSAHKKQLLKSSRNKRVIYDE